MKTKAERSKELLFGVGLLAFVFLAAAYIKPVYVALILFWGLALSYPLNRLVTKTGWKFTHIEWYLMGGFFCIGLILLLSNRYLFPNHG